MKSFLKKNLRISILSLSLAGIFFALGFFQKYHLPRIKNWLLVEIEDLSRKHSPVWMWANDVELHLFPVGVSFHDIRLQPQGELKATLVTEKLDELGLYLSFFGFLRGRIELGEVHLKGSNISFFIKDGGPRTTPLSIDIKQILDLPVNSVRIEDFELAGKIEQAKLALKVADLDLTLATKGKSIEAEINARKLHLKRSEDPAIFEIDLDALISANNREINLARLRVEKDNSFLLTSGWAEWTPKDVSVQRIVGRARASLSMPDVYSLLREIFPNEALPKLEGQVTFEAQTDHTLGAKLSGGFELNSKDLRIAKYLAGNIDTQGLWTEQSVSFNRFTVDHPGGQFRLEGLELSQARPIQVSAKVFGRTMDIHKLLKGLGINDVPVFSNLEPELNCKTQVLPFNKLSCQGGFAVQSMRIDDGIKNGRPIVELKNGSVTGDVTVDQDGVKYTSSIELPNSKGQSDGIILYKKGFDINFSSDKLDLGPIKDISGVPLSGEIKISGNTKGNSEAAGFTARIESEDFYLDNYRLAKLQTQAQYKAGHLRFQDIKGEYRTTKYSADVDLDLRKKRLAVSAKVPLLDLLHLQELVESRWPIPFELTGTGEAFVNVTGPLNNPKSLDFNIKAKTFRGLIGKESYDQIQFDIASKDGTIAANNVWLTKGPGKITVKGTAKMGGDLNGGIDAENLRLEQSESLASLGLKFAGKLNLTTLLTGKLDDPDVEGRGELTDIVLGDQAVDRTAFEFSLNKLAWIGSAEFGEKVAEIFWNVGLSNKAPISLNAKFKNWDFSRAFSVFSRSLRTEIYGANLNGEMKLKGFAGQIDQADAEIKLEDLYIKADDHELRNTGPMLLTLKNGRATTSNFEIKGSDSFLKLGARNSQSKDLNLLLDGRLDLKVLGLLTPFLDDIRGKLNLNVAIGGGLSSPELSGSAFVEAGYVRAREFPHPLEQTSADIVFDNKKLVLNSLRGRLGGGTINASGQISFVEAKQLPIDIRGQFVDSTFQVPPGFTTRGSGGFSLKGNWFPYTLQLNYDIVSGFIDKELKANALGQKEIKPSAYLPKFLVESRFSPVNFDFDISLPQDFPVKLKVTRLDIESKISGGLKITGPPENPILDGRIRIAKGGKINFRDNTFEIQSGLVEYRNSPPENPNLNISAESRVRATIKADEQKDFDVSLRVLGTASDPKVTVSSQPALSESELLSLLTLGFITQDETDASLAGNATQDGIANTSYQLGSAFLNEQLGLNREIGKRLGLEFDFSSGFSSEDQAAVHTFTVKKQWTPKFGTSASRSVGKTSTSNVKAEYRISNTVSVIGNYEGREQLGASDATTTEDEDNLFGLDFEYKMDFK